MLNFGVQILIISVMLIVFILLLGKHELTQEDIIEPENIDSPKFEEINDLTPKIHNNAIEETALSDLKKIQSKQTPFVGRDFDITFVEGIGSMNAEKLFQENISKTSDLLKACSTTMGLTNISNNTGISSKLLFKWKIRSDLLRVQGINNEYSELLEKEGLESVDELSQIKPKELYLQLLEHSDKSTQKPPSIAMIKRWIRIAKDLSTKNE
ncbi:MAG: DUF4332 domain-containing protein [Candidatus Hodarchaeales archaeon]